MTVIQFIGSLISFILFSGKKRENAFHFFQITIHRRNRTLKLDEPLGNPDLTTWQIQWEA